MKNQPTNPDQIASPAGPAEPAASSPSSGTVFNAGPIAISRAEAVLLLLLATAFIWTYWPTWAKLAHAWNIEPDYSHGYFVVPLALYFLWLRRGQMPQPAGPGWGGLILIGAGLGLDIFGSRYYLDSVNGWSMAVWLAGAAWVMGGRSFCRWCLPSLLFLLFMVPLPYRVEIMFRHPLQRIATEVSCWTLQFLGLPALATGNVIAINDVELEVAQACSGLRIFVSIVALAFAYAVIARRPWWIKALVFASTLPIAVLANAVRVSVVALSYPYATTPEAHRWAHDLAGWFVIPLAAVLMGGFILYLGRLIVRVQPLAGRELLRG